MTNYLKHEKKILEQEIRDYYSEHKGEILEELFKIPLREFTYEERYSPNIGKYFNDKGDAMKWQVAKGLAVHLDVYIHKFNIKVDKDITLEEAVKKII